MRPEDLALVRTVADPRLHPDGRRVAFVVTGIDLEEDRYVSRIHLFDPRTPGAVDDRSRVLTHGPGDTRPRWSPDGRWLAFLRRGPEDGAKPQLVVLSVDGGEALPLTDLPLGAVAFDWAPDSDRLVVVGRTWIEELADLDDDERRRRPRRLTRTPYRGDDRGWIADRRDHLYLVRRGAQPGEEELLTAGDFDETGARWHPREDRIAFLSQRHDDRSTEPGEQVFELDLDTGEVEARTGVGHYSALAYAPDGRLHAVGLEHALAWPSPLRVLDLDGDEPTDRTAGLDRTVVGDDLAFLDDGGLLVRVEDRGRVQVVRIAPDGGSEVVVGGDRTVSGLAAGSDGTVLALTVDDPADPGELVWVEDGEERTVTDVNARFRAEVEVVPTRHLTYERDGAEIDGWLLLPPGDADRVPLVLNIHGGPTGQYGFTFFDEFQVYAAAGYAVIGTNPRGSSGRGRDWMRAVVGAWGDNDSVDMLDLRAAVDAAIGASERIDPDRLGIMGGSYGGYAVARILASDDRFRSAVVERGLLQWESFSGTSDIGQYFDRMFLGSSLADGGDLHRLASPVGLASRVRTPTLVLHSEEDWRCPIEQAEQFFAALLRHGVESEFVRFPGEGHELSRSGAPKHRVERFQAILDWHDRHLS
ncbi:MAG: S9 family peptidase [Actinobacteria bacterium]|nr:S9 family peptidase [Actinomycetota bacterium]